jgi:hypothetical protein
MEQGNLVERTLISLLLLTSAEKACKCNKSRHHDMQVYCSCNLGTTFSLLMSQLQEVVEWLYQSYSRMIISF